MSVYKEPKEWIDNAVESIVKQTYTDWELIIISDNPEGHKQNNCIKEWTTKDNRIKVIYNDKNIGLTSSLNKGLAISNGDYIAASKTPPVICPLEPVPGIEKLII